MDGKRVIGWSIEIDIKVDSVDVNPTIGLDMYVDTDKIGIDIQAIVNNLSTKIEVFIGCELETISDMSNYATRLWVATEMKDMEKAFNKLLRDKLSANDLKTINGESIYITDPSDTNIEIDTSSAIRYNFESASNIWVIPDRIDDVKTVFTYDFNGDIAIGTTEIYNGNISITFSEPFAGYAIVIK